VSIITPEGRDITKISYGYGLNTKTGRPNFTALSDIGYDILEESKKKYFLISSYDTRFVEELNNVVLFLVPTLVNMLSEKLYYYIKYSVAQQKLGQGIVFDNPENISISDCIYYKGKFRRAIIKLVEAMYVEKIRDLEIDTESPHHNKFLFYEDIIKDCIRSLDIEPVDENYILKELNLENKPAPPLQEYIPENKPKRTFNIRFNNDNVDPKIKEELIKKGFLV
jgi:predicted transcriptional regulator